MLSPNEIRQQFIDFFVKKHQHRQLASASLIPENDPTVLFTIAGMHPLIPYLMGAEHPAGTRLVDSQKCIRTDDIDEVGDETHCTFFEMLGNWSLGDYFKKEAVGMSYELLTTAENQGGFGIDPKRIRVSCFEGDENAPRDEETAGYWKEKGFVEADKAEKGDRSLIYFYEAKKNWWKPGPTGPCGPDTEIFFDRNPELEPSEHMPGSSEEMRKKYPLKDGSGKCHPNCECGRYIEIWNNVFMQYNRTAEGVLVPLAKKNVDTGMGFERIVATLQGKPNHYLTGLFSGALQKLADLLNQSGSAAGLPGQNHTGEQLSSLPSARIVADHLRAATFLLGDQTGIVPSNTDQGYILRRLIRRAIRHGRLLGLAGNFTDQLAEIYIREYSPAYPELEANRVRILSELRQEEEKFQRTLENGLREMKKLFAEASGMSAEILAEKAFFLFESYGFPQELIVEELQKEGLSLDLKAFATAFDAKFAAHQALSRAGSDQKFKGGLADSSDASRNLHTATHLLHKALKIVLGPEVAQKGSNITPERLRFDFNYPQKMTPEQLQKVEEIVNEQIKRKIPVTMELLPLEEARKRGATGLFEDKYGNEVKVYTIGDFSMEICGGPHADNTGDLVSFKILKEEASSAGVRRIKAVIG